MTADASPRSVSFPRVFLLVVGFCALVVGVRWALQDRMEPAAALAALRQVRGEPWVYPAFLVVYFLATLALLPAAGFHVVAGAAFGFPIGLLLSVACCNLAANAQFALGRKVGRQGARRLLERLGLAKLEANVAAQGVRAFVVLRMLPLPFFGANLAAAMSTGRQRDFAAGTFLGFLPIGCVHVYFATALVEGVAGAREEALWHVVGASAALLALLLGPRLLLKLWRRDQSP